LPRIEADSAVQGAGRFDEEKRRGGGEERDSALLLIAFDAGQVRRLPFSPLLYLRLAVAVWNQNLKPANGLTARSEL
jgi:hypothetical protein